MSDANEKIRVRFEVNGDMKDIYVAPQSTLVEVLRKEFQLTGTKEGCDDGNCGACTVLMNGKAVKSCCILIGQVEGASITTIEASKKETGSTRSSRRLSTILQSSAVFVPPE